MLVVEPTRTNWSSDALLAPWDTSTLPTCAYTLRLIVFDTAVIDGNGAIQNRAEYTVTVNVGGLCPVDLDGDGDEDLLDYAAFQECFTGPF
jgi:hypothetical protein